MTTPDDPGQGSPTAIATPRPVRLDAWLRSLDQAPRDELRIGVTGHLLLSPAEEHNVVDKLRRGVLPRLLPRGTEGRVCLLTGLAPGSDLLFTRTASAWLREAGIAHRIVGLLPVPAPTLHDDWLHSLRNAGHEPSPAEQRMHRQQIESTLACCDAVVDLMPAAPGDGELHSESFRQRQYRRLAACLAQRSDVLVAILREQNLLKPGGTAEVVHWRRHPRQVPEEFSTGLSAAPAGVPGRRLIVIDPAKAG